MHLICHPVLASYVAGIFEVSLMLSAQYVIRTAPPCPRSWQQKEDIGKFSTSPRRIREVFFVISNTSSHRNLMLGTEKVENILLIWCDYNTWVIIWICFAVKFHITWMNWFCIIYSNSNLFPLALSRQMGIHLFIKLQNQTMYFSAVTDCEKVRCLVRSKPVQYRR